MITAGAVSRERDAADADPVEIVVRPNAAAEFSAARPRKRLRDSEEAMRAWSRPAATCDNR